MTAKHPIGVFDSGFGGLTILKALQQKLPNYDYRYLGDNARAPYGDKSFESVYAYTLEAVNWFFEQGCHLIILACNTASAKALRSIQQKDLPKLDPQKRVLGVIRPTAELIGNYSKSGHIAVMGTLGTIQSDSYLLEIQKFFPKLSITQQACPMWVPLIENNEYNNPGADYFVKKYLDLVLEKDPKIDRILLACTHYPLLSDTIRQYIPKDILLVEQGEIVAQSLQDYLFRHPEMDAHCSKNGITTFFTTGDTAGFDDHATRFFEKNLHATHVQL